MVCVGLWEGFWEVGRELGVAVDLSYVFFRSGACIRRTVRSNVLDAIGSCLMTPLSRWCMDGFCGQLCRIRCRRVCRRVPCVLWIAFVRILEPFSRRACRIGLGQR